MNQKTSYQDDKYNQKEGKCERNGDTVVPQTILESLEDTVDSFHGDSMIDNYIPTNTDNELDLQIGQMIVREEGIWKCKVCGKTAANKQNISNHAERHIEGVSHDCHICSKTSSTRRNLQQHISDYHSELFSCDICGKSAMNRKSYRECKYKYHRLSVKQ